MRPEWPSAFSLINYVAPFIKDLAKDTAIIYDRLKKNPKAWSDDHTKAIKRIKEKVKNLPCLTLANPNWEKSVETDASDIGYGGILTQYCPDTKRHYIVQPIDADHIIEGESSNKKGFYDSLNKISEKYARKPAQRMFYYPRPTPQDVLLEEHEQLNGLF